MADTAPTDGPATGPRRQGRLREPARWAGVGVLLFLVGAAWAAAMPLMAGPDEPSHVFWAAAVARGQLEGDLGAGAQDASRPGAGTMVDLPTDYAAAASLPNCFAFLPEVSADCQQDLAPPVPGEVAEAETFAGQYPPLYYALVGWPSLFLDAEAAVYGMRLASAALAAALLTWGARTMTRAFGRAWGAWGTAVAVTPMWFFLAGTVNPQALEVSAAFVFWAACLALVRGTGPAATSTVVQSFVGGALLVNARATSPVWAVVVVAVALVLAPPGRWRELVRHPAVRWVGAATLAVAAVAGGWLLTHPVLVEGAQLHPDLANPLRAAAAAASHTFDYLTGAVGVFGWLDTAPPPLTVVTWSVAAVGAVLVALATRTAGRARAALALLVLAVLGAPVLLQIPGAAQTGLIWQGRYVLPAAVGLPLVCVAVVASTTPTVQDLLRRTGRLVVPLIGLAHVGAFWWASRRFAEGTDGDLITVAPEWVSPIGYLSGVAAYAALVAVLTWVVWAALRPVHDTVVHAAGSPDDHATVP